VRVLDARNCHSAVRCLEKVDLSHSKDPIRDGERNCVYGVAGAQLPSRIGYMVLSGLDTDGQSVCNPLSTFTASKQTQALYLTWRQARDGAARHIGWIESCRHVIHIVTIGRFLHDFED
jgi:hypothetical protein